MDWLIKLASKVGGSVFAIAFIIFFAFIMWVVATEIENAVNALRMFE